jgi:hypothetical protein
MDIEQLKLILDAARAAGDGAMTIVFVWFALKFFIVILVGSIVSSVAYGIYKLAAHSTYNSTFIGRIETLLDIPLWHRNRREDFLKWLKQNYKKDGQ